MTMVGPGHFQQWRSELGKSAAEMAEIVGIRTTQYERAETTAEIPLNHHIAITTAFEKLGKTPTPIEQKRH
jgi:DNA-binding XRE family transcriptional regulator